MIPVFQMFLKNVLSKIYQVKKQCIKILKAEKTGETREKLVLEDLEFYLDNLRFI